MNTGPKGVLTDYRIYQLGQKLKKEAEERAYLESISERALSSGWLQRQLALEQNSSVYFPPEVLKTLPQLDQENFIETIEDPQLVDSPILIHVYSEKHPDCRLLHKILPVIQSRYPASKFYQSDLNHLPITLDYSVLPAILVYHGGDLVDTLLCLRIELETFIELNDEESDDEFIAQENQENVDKADRTLNAQNLTRYLRQMGHI